VAYYTTPSFWPFLITLLWAKVLCFFFCQLFGAHILAALLFFLRGSSFILFYMTSSTGIFDEPIVQVMVCGAVKMAFFLFLLFASQLCGVLMVAFIIRIYFSAFLI